MDMTAGTGHIIVPFRHECYGFAVEEGDFFAGVFGEGDGFGGEERGLVEGV
jgi:hypothetical protein